LSGNAVPVVVLGAVVEAVSGVSTNAAVVWALLALVLLNIHSGIASGTNTETITSQTSSGIAFLA